MIHSAKNLRVYGMLSKMAYTVGCLLLLSTNLSSQNNKIDDNSNPSTFDGTFYSDQGPAILKSILPFSKNSFCINPIQLSNKIIDSILQIDRNSSSSKLTQFHLKNIKISLAPITFYSINNSTIPIGINQGNLIPNVGNQKLISAGVNISWKNKLSIHIAPEFQTAENKAFGKYPNYSTDWAAYYYYLNNSDIPEQQGESALKKLYPGQSYIKYHLTNFDIALSTENKWWGPATFNPLILGTNAGGFWHGSFATNKPIETKIGSFEGEAIGGLLEQSGFFPPETYRLDVQQDAFLYQPKKRQTRYVTGLVYTYQPIWVPGLYLGLAKLSMLYTDELKNGLDYLPLEGFLGNKITPTETSGRKASMGSWFMRYVMPTENAEIYYEYGRSDESLHIGNILQQNPYGRGFTGGLKKGYEINNKYGMIQLGFEITTLSLPEANLVYSKPKSWYLNNYVRQGFTNKGKVLGAGIGPGSNSQTLFVQWMKGLQNFGVRVNRTIHNLDFYHSTHYYNSNHFNQYWATVSTTAYFSTSYKKITLAGEYIWQRDLNYEWEWTRYTNVGFENIGNDIYSTGGRVLIRYRW